MKKLLVTLTPAESKRLIAKGLLATDEITAALQDGYLCIPLGTTSAYLVEEILGKYDKTKHIAGVTVASGLAVTKKDSRASDAIFYKGELLEKKKVVDVLDKLGPHDVIVKGANALDSNMTPLILLAGDTGGTIGSFIGTAATKNIITVMPIGLEKCIPAAYEDLSGRFGRDEWDYSLGTPVGIMAVPEGIVYTETDALQTLFGVEAVPIAAGGVNGAEGSVTFFVEGFDEDIDRVYEFLQDLKGEPPFPEISEIK
jgi:hypothetical protein